ncbi:MAG: anaerobic ribonucleoside-triphosphate reductase activating protein [Actinobacteria bacterium]|nr:MAG: anaerobic ribonucleoside-triphosphate reductase activating protein [Actinomycetota bacterium]
MDIALKGFIASSMLDWDGKLACVLFTGGCNLKCVYCHNADLVLTPNELPNIDFSLVEKHLLKKKDWIDGCVVTGGEPLIHSWLPQLLEKIKSLGFKTKLDTNGVLSGALIKLLNTDLVDYVAMDIKTSFVKYCELVNIDVDLQEIKKSIAVLSESGVEHEFRTTVVPQYVEKSDLVAIAKYIKGSKAYFLQQYKPDHTLEPQTSNIAPYSEQELKEMAQECSKYVMTKVRC